MSSQAQGPGHIEITETLVRLYVFLTHYLDRCLDEAARKEYPDEELHAHLATTRATMADIAKVVTPDLKAPGESVLLLVDLAAGKRRLGGTALAQVFGETGRKRWRGIPPVVAWKRRRKDKVVLRPATE